MKTEYEIRILEINKNEIIKRLEELGAEKIGEFEQKRYVYDLKPVQKSKWIRLRTNGKTTTLTYKDIVSNTIDGTKTNELLECIGFNSRSYQENKRVQYILNGVEIDIDSWPMIPTYLEIEGNAEKEVIDVVEILGVNKSKLTALNCEDIYREIYGIDIVGMKELKFQECFRLKNQ